MSVELLPATQFSIYKINLEEVETELIIDRSNSDKDYIDEIVNGLVEYVDNIICERRQTSSLPIQVKYSGFTGLIFKTIHEPLWKGVVQHILSGNEFNNQEIPTDLLTNTNVSYILFYKQDKNLYAVTGGYGSKYINKFICRNFGLYLLPKIVKRDSPIIRQVLENSLTGIQMSVSRANRNPTSFFLEQDMGNIFRQLCAEIDRDVAEELGITFDEQEPQNKKVNVINKDSLIIRRSLTLNELKDVIKRINRLERKRDNFALNYFIPAQIIGIKNSDIFDRLIDKFEKKLQKQHDPKDQQEEERDFVIVGDEYANYYLNCSRYIIVKDNGEEYINSTEPITIEYLFQKLKVEKKRISQSFLRNLLKHWKITTLDNSGNTVLYPISIYKALQGYIDEGVPQACYLYNGIWYVLDNKYDDIIKKDYESLYDKTKAEADEIKREFKLDLYADSKTENKYNEKFYTRQDIIVAHEVPVKNVEFADMIFWDEEKLYLMHVKTEFKGSAARDLINQILTSAQYIQMVKMSKDRDSLLTEYYNKIKEKYEKLQETKDKEINIAISEKDFIDAFNNKRICYVGCYLKSYKRNTQSRYCRYLTIELNRKLEQKMFEFIPMGIN